MAEVIYRESKGESYKGKLAVGQVVLTRIKHRDYPGSVCAVIFQKNQFSWVKGFKTFKAPAEFKRLAEVILDGEHELSDFHATHFHAKYVRPAWGKKLRLVAVIGNHIFYNQI